jgi:hypothetical protein
VLAHPAGGVVVERAQRLCLLAPLHRRPHKPQRVVDVFLTAPQAVAGVGDDGDIGRADDAASPGSTMGLSSSQMIRAVDSSMTDHSDGNATMWLLGKAVIVFLVASLHVTGGV